MAGLFDMLTQGASLDTGADPTNPETENPNSIVAALRKRLIDKYSQQASGNMTPDGQFKITYPQETEDGQRVTTPAPKPLGNESGAPSPAVSPPVRSPVPATTTASPGTSQAANPFERNFLQQLSDVFMRASGAPVPNYPQMNMTYQFLLKQPGMTPDKAAMVISNPDIMKQMLAQMFGPKTAPTTTKITDPNTGLEYTAQWNPQANRWERLDLGSLSAAGSPAQPTSTSPQAPAPGSAPSPAAAPNQAGIYSAPLPPPGTDVKTFRTEQAKKIADEEANDRDKTTGAVEFLQQVGMARKIVADNGDVIGRYASPGVTEGGSIGVPGIGHVSVPSGFLGAPIATTLKTLRDIQGEVPTITGQPNVYAAENTKRDLLDQMFTKLAQSGLKATYGSRVTNIDVNQQQKTVPTLTDQSADTSNKKLDTLEDISWRTVKNGIRDGVINPGALPPEVIRRGIETGNLSPANFPAYQLPAPVSSALSSAGIDLAHPATAPKLKALVDDYFASGGK